jgi:hypothetical protein
MFKCSLLSLPIHPTASSPPGVSIVFEYFKTQPVENVKYDDNRNRDTH